MANISEIVSFCDGRINLVNVPDFPGSYNGLQFQNSGKVSKVGAAVDAGLIPFRIAVEKGIDFLIVHHGMFWDPFAPITGAAYEKVKTLADGNLAVYGAHLPLDLHPEIGNNAILARQIGLHCVDTFLPYEGNNVGTIAAGPISREDLSARLQKAFPSTFRAVEFGGKHIEKVAILTGSGQSAIPFLREAGVDTLVTGEVKQNAFNQAQELALNLYMCGHYRTETFGVRALAQEVSEKFSIPWEFIETECPL